MPDVASTRLRLRKQQDAGNNNTWGVYLNDDVIELVDEAIAGVSVVAVAAAVTLSSTNFDSDQARKATLIFTGAGGFDVTIPAVEKIYVVHNKCAAAVGVKTGGGAVASVGAGSRALVYTDGTDVFSVANNNVVPVGTVSDYAGLTAPAGWLFLHGQAVSRTTYAPLFAVLGTTYGAGDGTTTFNLPDGRGRVIAGQDDMGGTSANRLTGLSGGVDGDTLGAAGGAESHALTSSELAVHTHAIGGSTGAAGTHNHTVTDPTHTHIVPIQTGTPVGAGVSGQSGTFQNTYNQTSQASSTGISLGAVSDHTHTLPSATGSAGSNVAHNNVQPTLILNKIIFTGV